MTNKGIHRHNDIIVSLFVIKSVSSSLYGILFANTCYGIQISLYSKYDQKDYN